MVIGTVCKSCGARSFKSTGNRPNYCRNHRCGRCGGQVRMAGPNDHGKKVAKRLAKQTGVALITMSPIDICMERRA